MLEAGNVLSQRTAGGEGKYTVYLDGWEVASMLLAGVGLKGHAGLPTILDYGVQSASLQKSSE